MENVLFFHGTTVDDQRFTIAGLYCTEKRILRKSKNFLKLSIALCSPKDTFAKKVGRAKAEGRLYSNKTTGKTVIPVSTTDLGVKTFIDCVKQFTLVDSTSLKIGFNIPTYKTI
jgi:hypothetical protein